MGLRQPHEDIGLGVNAVLIGHLELKVHSLTVPVAVSHPAPELQGKKSHAEIHFQSPQNKHNTFDDNAIHVQAHRRNSGQVQGGIQ